MSARSRVRVSGFDRELGQRLITNLDTTCRAWMFVVAKFDTTHMVAAPVTVCFHRSPVPRPGGYSRPLRWETAFGVALPL